MATPAQTSANSTGWSLKKLPTISVRTPSQSPRRVTSARRVFYHMAPPGAPFQPQAAASSVVAGRASSSGDSVPTSSGWAVRTCRSAFWRSCSSSSPQRTWPQPQGITPEMSIAISPKGRRKRACSSSGSAVALAGVGVGELEVRGHLLEVPHELCACCSLEHGQECAQGFDGEPRLVEVAALLGEPAVSERRDGVERLDEDVRHLERLQLLLELLQELVVGGRPALGHDGSHSSKRFPSTSLAQANRPYSISSTRSSTSTPAARSCASMASRSRTRKLTINCCPPGPKYAVSAGKGAQTVWSPSFEVNVVP